MKFSGLFRTGALALLIFGQFAVPNLAFSQKGQLGAASKPHLKSEKESSDKNPAPKSSGKDVAAKPEPEKKNAVNEKKPEPGKPLAKSAATKPEADKKNVLNEKKPEVGKPPAKSAAVKPEADKKTATIDKKTEEEKPGKQEAGKKTVATDAGSSTSESQKNHSHAAKSHANDNSGLIPPPPAFQPSYLINPSGLGSPFQPEFMTKEMALQRLKDVDKQVADAKSELEDKTAKVKDMKEKSERFASLYTEGVVSRHELEAAGKEAEEAQKELDQFKASVAELESEKKALNDRVKPAAKKNLQASKTSSNHKRRTTGSRS